MDRSSVLALVQHFPFNSKTTARFREQRKMLHMPSAWTPADGGHGHRQRPPVLPLTYRGLAGCRTQLADVSARRSPQNPGETVHRGALRDGLGNHICCVYR